MEERLGARLHGREIRCKAARRRLGARLHGREIRCKATWKRD